MSSRNSLVRNRDLVRNTVALNGNLEINGVDVLSLLETTIQEIDNTVANTVVTVDTSTTRAKTLPSLASIARLEDLSDPQMILIVDPQLPYTKTVTCRLYANSGPSNFKLKAYSFVLYWDPANVTLSKLTMGDTYAPWDGITLGYKLGANAASIPTPQVRYYQFGSSSFSSYVNMDQIPGTESFYNYPCVRCVCTLSSGTSTWNAPGALTAGFNVGKAIPIGVFEFTMSNTWTGERECVKFGFCNDFINQGTQDYSSIMAHRTTNDGFTWGYGTYPDTYVESSKIPMIDNKFVGAWTRFSAFCTNKQTTLADTSISTGALTLAGNLAIPGYANVASALASAGGGGTTLVQRTDNGAINGDVWGLSDGWPSVPATNDTDLATIALIDSVFAKSASSYDPVVYSAHYVGAFSANNGPNILGAAGGTSWTTVISHPNVSVSSGYFTVTRTAMYRLGVRLMAQSYNNMTPVEAIVKKNTTFLFRFTLLGDSGENGWGGVHIVALTSGDTIFIETGGILVMESAPYGTWVTFDEIATPTIVGLSQAVGDTLYQPKTGDVTVTGKLTLPGFNDVAKTLRDMDDIVVAKLTQTTADSLYQPLIGDIIVTGTLAIPGYANVATTLGSLSTDVSGKLTQAMADTLYQPITGNVTVTGTLAIPGYANVATTLGTLSTEVSGKLTQATANTLYQPKTGNVTVTGTLAIPGYANVATTLGTFLTNTGITNSTTLTIAKSVQISSNWLYISSFTTDSFSANKLTYATSGGFSWYGETEDHNADLDAQSNVQVSLKMDYALVTPQIYITSDDRVKVRETPITGALAAINKLTPVYYQKLQGGAMVAADYEDAPPAGVGWTAESGLVAQDVFNNCPEISPFVNPGAVDPDTGVESLWTVKYDSIFTWGLAATKELAAKVEALEARLAALEAA